MAPSYQETEYYRDDDERPAPPSVVAAVACGTAPVPFLAVYAVMFLVHGSVHPVVPPDITSSTRGEFWSGVVAAVLFLACSVSLVWAVSGSRRWPFASTQLLMFLAAGYFLIDGHEGGDFISALVLVVTFAALVLVFLPQSWPHYANPRRPRPEWLSGMARGRNRTASAEPSPAEPTMPAGSAPVSDSTPATARVAGRPRPAGAPDDPAR